MLTELRVENYAVIEQLAVNFAGGLNLLTGETGAGKSILIDALSLLLGEKASSDVVRHGAEKAVVSGVFSLKTSAAQSVARVLEENGIDSDDPEQLILRREVQANGKGRVFINTQPATVGLLRQVAPMLAFIHAQNETLAHFDDDERRKLLDGFAGLDVSRAAELFAQWRALSKRIAELEQGEQDRLRQVDLWRFQRDEIESAQLRAGEDETLELERRRLLNAEKLQSAASRAYDALYGEEQSALTSVRAAQKHIEELATFDATFSEAAQSLISARALIEDVAETARDYADGIEASPERLAQVEDRLAAIQLLKRKYGQTLDEVIAYGESVAQKLDEVDNRDQILAELQKQLAAASAAYSEEARSLSRKRLEAAVKLATAVERNINELAMRVKFQVAVSASEQQSAWAAHGWDEIKFLIATNAGEPTKPLEEIASGGELSRVMLAMKAAVFEAKRKGSALRTLVFDEIDTGIGGRAAEAVGKKLKQLSQSHQVLCITHLPQIASFADRHFVIEKRVSSGRTATRVRAIEGRERTEEIARMLSGAQLTAASIANAEQMLQSNSAANSAN